MSEIEPFRLNTWIIVVEALDTDGDPLDLNNYDACYFAVKESLEEDDDNYLIGPVEGEFQEYLEDGILTFRLEYTQTDAPKGDWWYDVLLKKDRTAPAEDEFYTLAKDRCRIKQVITVPPQDSSS